MNQRRDFIRSLGLAVSTLVVTRSVWASCRKDEGIAVSPRGSPLGFSEFERLKGTRFEVSGDGSPGQVLELDEVLKVSRDPRVEAVSLRFQGTADARLAERTYRFSRPGWGTFDLFIQPGTVTGSRCSYRVIVCHLA